jgi:hypothetical protein
MGAGTTLAKTRSKPQAARKPRPVTGAGKGRKKRSEKELAEEAFTRSLVAHGQAVTRAPGEALPPGATHELIVNEKGETRVVRRRFSLI